MDAHLQDSTSTLSASIAPPQSPPNTKVSAKLHPERVSEHHTSHHVSLQENGQPSGNSLGQYERLQESDGEEEHPGIAGQDVRPSSTEVQYSIPHVKDTTSCTETEYLKSTIDTREEYAEVTHLVDKNMNEKKLSDASNADTPIANSVTSYGSIDSETGTPFSHCPQKDKEERIQLEDGAVAPLSGSGVSKAGDISTFLNMIKANIGSGILGMPYAFRHGGVVLGGVTVFVLMCIAVYCVHMLVVSKEHIKRKTGKPIRSYAEVAWHAFGMPGQLCLEAVLLFCQFGFCTSYLIFIGENLNILFPFMRNWFWILVTMMVVAPFCLIRNPKYLAPTAFAALAVLVASASIILYYDFVSLDMDVVRTVKLFNIAQFPIFLGISIFSFEGIGMALPIHENMKNGHSTTRFTALLLLAMFIITTSLAVFGICGYIAFGEDIRDVITLNLPNDGLLSVAVTFGLMISVFFTYPFAMFPLTEVFDTYLRSVKFDESSAHRDRMFHGRVRFHLENAIRLLVVVLSAIVAIVGQKAFGLALSIVGGLGGSCLAFIFPTLIYIRTCRHEMRWYTYLVCAGIIVFGILAAVLTTLLAAMDIAEKLFPAAVQ